MSEVVSYHDVFIRNVKNLMIKHKLNQYTLAEKIGLSQTGARLILNGESNPTLKTIIAICDAFNVSIRDMFTPYDEQFGEQVSKDEEILELKQEVIRRNVKIEEMTKLLNEVDKKESAEGKVEVVMNGDLTLLSVFGKPVDYTQITSIDIYKKTIEVALKFDELSVR